MTKTVMRYTDGGPEGWMQSPTGEFVRYEDYAALERECRELQQLVPPDKFVWKLPDEPGAPQSKFDLAFEIMRQLEAEHMDTMQSCQFGYVLRVEREPQCKWYQKNGEWVNDCPKCGPRPHSPVNRTAEPT